MKRSPSTNGDNGRGPNGRFAKGNPGGPGNPLGGKVAALRATLVDAVTPDDIREVVAALLVQAKEGEIAAVRELFQRLLGPPVELDLIERLDALEARLAGLPDGGGA
jgi:hypothetical protein